MLMLVMVMVMAAGVELLVLIPLVAWKGSRG
jgi:hypothetical protein